MANVTVRNLPDDVVERLKESARRKGHSMEQEIRELIEERYGSRQAVMERVRARWPRLPVVTAEQVARWRDEGRP